MGPAPFCFHLGPASQDSPPARLNQVVKPGRGPIRGGVGPGGENASGGRSLGYLSPGLFFNLSLLPAQSKPVPWNEPCCEPLLMTAWPKSEPTALGRQRLQIS